MPISVAAKDEDRLFLLQPLPCVDIGLDGGIVRANPAFCAMTGRSEDDLRERGLLATVCQDARDDVIRALLQAAQSDVSNFDSPICRTDGEVRWLQWHGVRVPTRNVVQFIAYDVTSARCMIDAHQERERFLSTLLSNLPGMVYRCKNDPQWTMEFMSAGCEALTGYGVDEYLEHRTITFGEVIHPEDADGVWQVVQAALANAVPFTIQYRIRTKSGDERWCYEQGRGVFADGELLALEGFITDITDRVQAEDELRGRLSLIEAQRQQIADLSLPIIEVWDGVLTLPLVGTLDAARATRITEGLLAAVVRTQCEHVIIDLTAVQHIDAEVAERLVAILRAVQLLGARGILSGIRPTAAKALVGLSTDLGGIPTTSDLRGALRSCMRLGGRSGKR